ncbi:hypothetical protein DNTS_013374 [Danionella cerebrum]|uniref:SH3 domain-containing protein n=1 Tax=Danionella cerebrum TaxID=2873325 RepID=A0A553R5X3_9TELE|nr:hypothetical protein DNTS_013374 [Danionella translucida]
MMEQDESTDFKTLRAGFEEENGLHIQTKPVVPVKPKSIPPPAKVSNPLVSSINAAVKTGAFHAPRVVFKDDKKRTRQLSQPLELKPKGNHPGNNTELPDTNQKVADTIKHNVKDLPLVQPGTPKNNETLELSLRTPVSDIPIKWSTPKKFVVSPQKSITDNVEQPNHGTEVKSSKKSFKDRNLPMVLPVAPKNTPEPVTSPLTPVSVPPSTPKSFVFTPPKSSKVENEKTDAVKDDDNAKSLKDKNLPLVLPPKTETSDLKSASVSATKVSTPKSFVFNTPGEKRTDTAVAESTAPVQHSQTPADSSKADLNPPINGVLASPKPVVSSPALSRVPLVADSPAPTSSGSLEPNIIPTQAVSKASKPETSSQTSDLETLKPNVNLLSLSEVFPPPEGSPPPDFTDIPPPVFEDFTDGDFLEQAIPTSATCTSPVPVERSSDSTSTPVVQSVRSPEVPTVPTPVDTVLENTRSPSNDDQTSTRPLSALSALARAEEMASVKRAPLDNRVFNLLERAKKKTTLSQMATTAEKFTPPEHSALTETGTPETPEKPTSKTEVMESVVNPPEKSLPQLSTVQAAQEGSAIPDLPPVDYVDQAHSTPKSQTPEPAKVNGLDNRVLTVVKPVHPPPPPPRKTLPATPPEEAPLEKRTQSPPTDLHIPIASLEHLKMHDAGFFYFKECVPGTNGLKSPHLSRLVENPQEDPCDILLASSMRSLLISSISEEDSLHNSSFGDLCYEDAEEPEATSLSTFKPPSAASSSSSPRMPMSVHEEAFLKQLSLKRQTDMAPKMEDIDQRSLNSTSTNPELPAAAQTSLPSGSLQGENVSEDHTEIKKEKAVKNKKQKGPPKNPYADTPTPQWKNSAKAVEDKELKKKEKQREKEKEKEEKERKEREKKEQKEREKKENEMRKKFKITGQEEAIYQVKVNEDCKGRKNDLLVKVGDTVSIIRTENCPKGKWLAKDSSNKYGYIPVESVDLNINGILELGKKATVSSRSSGNGHREAEFHNTNNRSSGHYEMNNESFSEDSEEWTCEDDDPEFCTPEETAEEELDHLMAAASQDHVQQNPSNSNYTNVQAKQEALHKLSTFFTQPKTPLQDNHAIHKEESEPSDVQILPPPDLYADILAGDSRPVQTKYADQTHPKIAPSPCSGRDACSAGSLMRGLVFVKADLSETCCGRLVLHVRYPCENPFLWCGEIPAA